VSEEDTASNDKSAPAYNKAWKTFNDFPISTKTKAGLEKAKFETPTTVQRFAIPHALAGRDILGAAKTGSGKTVRFEIFRSFC
jgi:ATP-dependent RNA helicase DDX10/DBP4